MSCDAWLIDNVLVRNYIDDLHTRGAPSFEIYFTLKDSLQRAFVLRFIHDYLCCSLYFSRFVLAFP